MRIEIINFPYRNYSYTQWLLFGFFSLEKEKTLSINKPRFFKLKKKLFKIINKGSDDYFFVFDVIRKKKRTRVVYDFSDTPFLFNEKWLEDCDFYFKAQFPKGLESGFFSVEDLFEYRYPYFVMRNKNKIKPSLIGIRNLGNNIDFDKMRKKYISIIKSSTMNKNIKDKFFIYFGSDQYDERVFKDNYYDEGFFYSKLSDKKSHPNEFRGDVVRWFQSNKNSCCYLGSESIGNYISLPEYHSKLSRYHYNINVSGFRYSIPNRFMDSFITNTRVLTDNLYIKWYVDFSDYVYEYGEVGYKKQSDLDKKSIYKRIECADKYFEERDNNINKFFNDYLSPKAFAKYVLSHC